MIEGLGASLGPSGVAMSRSSQTKSTTPESVICFWGYVETLPDPGGIGKRIDFTMNSWKASLADFVLLW